MTKPREIRATVERAQTARTPEAREEYLEEAKAMLDGFEDPYAARVRRFHDRVRVEGDEDYLSVLYEQITGEELGLAPEVPAEAVSQFKRVKAERNRLFWSSFLSEESGEVSKCLNDGEPAENFEKEVADVLVLCHAIADVFEFDMLEAFDRVMEENDQKPKRQEGTGKLPAEARDQW